MSKVKGRFFIQKELETLPKFRQLIKKHASAAIILTFLEETMDKNNGVVIGQKLLAKEVGLSPNTVYKSLKILKEGKWIKVLSLGEGESNIYFVNSRVAWNANRKRLETAKFSATVVIDLTDQEEDKEASND